MSKNYALITGGSSGIGAAYSEELAKRGYNILIVSNREDLNQSEKAKIEELYPEVMVVTRYLDLSAPEAAQELYDFCRSEDITVDFLVNNAGMFYFGAVTEKPLAVSQTMTALHCNTPQALSILFGSDMKRRNYGYIINAASITAFMSFPTIAVYEATKSYLLKFTKALSMELSHYGVKVCCVCPGAVDTDLYNLPKKIRKILRSLGIMLSPETIAKRGVRAVCNGRKVKIPGIINYFFLFLCFIVPDFIVNIVKKKFV